MAAVNHDRRTCYVAPGIGSEQQQRAVEILRCAEATLRNALDQGFTRWGGEEMRIDFGFDVARTQSVHPYSVPRPFQRQRLRKLQHTCLRGRIPRDVARDAKSEDR